MDRDRSGFLKIAVATVSVLLAVLLIVLAIVIIRERSVQDEKENAAPKNQTAVSLSDSVSSAERLSEAASEAERTVIPMRETEDDLRGNLDKIAKSYGAAAVQIAAIKNGAVAEYYNYGSADKSGKKPVTADTVFRAASLSKLIDAMAVMKLSEEGRMDIDADTGYYLGYRVRSPKYPDTVITPRMLMTHTSGIVDSGTFLKSRNSTSSTPLKKLLSLSSSYSGNRPGKAHRYSNFGAAVLAAAAEKSTGTPFYEYTENELFQPLGIKGSFLASRIADPDTIACLYDTGGRPSYSIQRQLREKCAEELGQTHHIYQGNITISATDYARLLCVLLNGGKGENGQQVLSSDSVNEILKVQYSDGGIRCGLCNFLSDGIVKGRTMHYHTGSNFGMYSSFAFDTDDATGVVVLTSGANAKKERSGVYNICGDMIREIYQHSAIE